MQTRPALRSGKLKTNLLVDAPTATSRPTIANAAT
jgi:hypothetical protein